MGDASDAKGCGRITEALVLVGAGESKNRSLMKCGEKIEREDILSARRGVYLIPLPAVVSDFCAAGGGEDEEGNGWTGLRRRGGEKTNGGREGEWAGTDRAFLVRADLNLNWAFWRITGKG